jgi:cyclic beta-1,2-glucan synthetase
MRSVEQRLIRWDDGLLLLFSPPFDQTPLDPGYIKGYVPGIRENGGQYTHAAIWSVAAFAMLGEGEVAADLFNLLSPIQHTSRRADVHRYKVEPYAVAADVYSQPPRRSRVDSRISEARFRPLHRSVHSQRVETLRDHLPSR